MGIMMVSAEDITKNLLRFEVSIMVMALNNDDRSNQSNEPHNLKNINKLLETLSG